MSSLTAAASANVHATRRFLRVVPCPAGGARPGALRAGPASARVAPGEGSRGPGPRAPPGRPIAAVLPSRGVTPLYVIAAGCVAIGAGTLLLRSYGPRARVGRLLAVTPAVAIPDARAIAAAGQRRYVRIDGRIDADDELIDENDRPLVFRRRRIDAHLAGGWRPLDDQRQQVPFRVRDGIDEIGIDADALDAGLVTLVRVSAGTAGEVPDLLPRPLPPDTQVRLRIEQLSSVEHVTALGVPVASADGVVRLTAGTGRPLVVSSLEKSEAMRVLAGGGRVRPLAAAIALLGGMALLALGFGWAVVAGIAA